MYNATAANNGNLYSIIMLYRFVFEHIIQRGVLGVLSSVQAVGYSHIGIAHFRVHRSAATEMSRRLIFFDNRHTGERLS